MLLCEPSMYFLYQVFRNLNSSSPFASCVWRLPSWEASYLFSSFNVDFSPTGGASFCRSFESLSNGHTLLHHPRSRVGRPAHHYGTMPVLPVLNISPFLRLGGSVVRRPFGAPVRNQTNDATSSLCSSISKARAVERKQSCRSVSRAVEA